MTALVEQVWTEVERRREKNKHRLALLALLLGLHYAYRVIVQSYLQALMGALLRIANANGELSSTQVPLIRDLIRGGLTKLAKDSYGNFDSAVIPAAHQGVEIVGGDAANYADGQRAAGEIVDRGARGVPFNDVVVNAVAQAASNLTSIITMAALSGATVKSIENELEALGEKLTNKLSGEAQTTVNAAFVAATRATAGTNDTTELRWNLSPAIDNHCPVCVGRDGNVYPVDDEVWNDLPAHPNCLCFATPIEQE